MSGFLFYQPGIPEGVLTLDSDESRHCVKVLRKRAGDAIRVTDGKGMFYDAVITRADSAECAFEIRGSEEYTRPSAYCHLAISPTKNPDRIEWFVEKATEIGVDRITLMQCHNTERSRVKSERLHRVAVSAMKQSFKAILPAISDTVVPFDEVVRQVSETGKFIAFVDRENPLHLIDAIEPGMSCCVLIGPEGDFTSDELALATSHGFRTVSLGPSRLRTETAGVVACHVVGMKSLRFKV